MSIGVPEGCARRRPARLGIALALISFVAALTVLIALASPAGAVVSNSTSRRGETTTGAETGEPGELNVVVLVVLTGLVVALVARVAFTDRIANRRSVRRFENQLRDADVVAICRQQIADDA